MVTFSIVSGLALTHVANHNPAFFFCPSMQWKTYHQVFHWKTYQVFLLKFFCPRQFFWPDNSNMFHMFKNNILISEQPKKSWFLVILSKRFNRTKVSHNQTLIGCLAVKLRSKFETESSKPYFYLAFFDKKQ